MCKYKLSVMSNICYYNQINVYKIIKGKKVFSFDRKIRSYYIMYYGKKNLRKIKIVGSTSF